MRHVTHILGGFIILVCLTACGMGGSTLTGSTSTVTIHGTVAKGIFTSGTVTAYRIEQNAKGGVLSSAQIAGDGSYSLTLQKGIPVLLEAWGAYTDEATGTSRTVPQSAPLRVTLASTTNGAVAITPLTELACRLMADYSPDEIRRALTLVETMFKIDDIVATQPLPYDPTARSYAGKSADAVEYTTILATLSKLDADDPGRDMNGVIDMIKGDIAAGQMSSDLSSTLQTTARTLLGDISPWPDLGRIGNRKVTVTLSITGSAQVHSGFQVTLKLPDTVYVPTRDSSQPIRSVVTTYYEALTNISVPGDYSPVVFDSQNRTLTVILLLDKTFTTGDIIAISFDIPAGSSPPASLSYNGLKIPGEDTRHDQSARLSARVYGTSTSVELVQDDSIPTPAQ